MVELSTDTPVVKRARIDPQERHRSEERVGHDLEGERGKGRVIARPSLFLLVLVAVDDSDHRRQIGRRRQVIDHRVEHRLHAFVLECGAEHDRNDLDLEGRGAHRPAQHVGRDLGALPFEVELHDLLVMVGELLDHLVAIAGGRFAQVGGNFLDAELGAETILVPDHRLVLDQVDHAGELFFRADRDLQRNRIGLELLADLLDHAREVGADAIHLVDERDARHPVLVGLAPYGLGLRLHAADRAEHRDRAVEHAQAAFDLDGEIDVAGRIDDVDAMVAPETGGRGGRDRDAAFLLLHHPVHGRGTLVHFTDFVVDPGVVEDSLGGGGLTGIDMGHDADIAHPFYWRLASHYKYYLIGYQR